MKPMLASDWDKTKVVFPCIVQPKIDGVRGVNFFGTLTGRSLKKHGNKHVTSQFSRSEFVGLDGELAVANVPPYEDRLCSLTTSALSTFAGEPEVHWWVFDFVTPMTKDLPYEERLVLLAEHIVEHGLHLKGVRIIPWTTAYNLEQLEKYDQELLELGYEGTIIRKPNAVYKYGRSTIREGGLLRIKRFIEEEAMVVGFTEGDHNANEAQTNELGQTERSTHKENMIPNGMIGNLICEALKDVYDDSGKLLITCGQQITVGPGKLDHNERKYYFEHPDKIIGRVVKFKFFPKGIKDKPRFPTFQSFRTTSDI